MCVCGYKETYFKALPHNFGGWVFPKEKLASWRLKKKLQVKFKGNLLVTQKKIVLQMRFEGGLAS